MNWSSPFTEEPRKKQKIVSTKNLDTEEDGLADYTPPKREPVSRKTDMDNVYETPMEYTFKPRETELLEKLNYMILLLEEQRDEKTSNVTEELILYVFLGVFTLFVLDTFVKNGKYSR